MEVRKREGRGERARAPVTDNHRMADVALEELRRICLTLPETTERLSHGEPTWFVRGRKSFVTYADHHHDDRLACWCAAPPGAQEALVAADPERYFRPPYVGHRGWVGIYLDVAVDWAEVTEIVTDAYRAVAPAKLIAQVPDDASAGSDQRGGQ
jgi:hypothetical protein